MKSPSKSVLSMLLGAGVVTSGFALPPAATAAIATPVSVAQTTVPKVPAPEVPAPEVPATAAPVADVLDVDFADGTAADKAQGLTATALGEPVTAQSAVLGRNVTAFDGDDALLYPMGAQYDALGDSMTVECVFQYNGSLPASGETNLCANKEAGGFSLTLYGDKLTFSVNTEGYKNAGVPIKTGQWYHAVGVYDGSSAKLYVNGVPAASVKAGTAITWPPNSGAHNFVVGADSSKTGAQFHATATIASARIFSTALEAAQIAALNSKALGEAQRASLELVSTMPAAGQRLTEAAPFGIEWNNEALVAEGAAYTLNGETITPGQLIGPGLAAGEHTLRIEARDVFGRSANQELTFSSAGIPTPGGVDTGQGAGAVTLSAVAVSPGGGDVTSKFFAGTAAVAEAGVQGLVTEIPASLEFAYTEGEELSAPAKPHDGAELASRSAVEGQIPFQRFDVEVGTAAPGQTVRWSGTVDPARQASLRVWNPISGSWESVAQGRGLADGQLVLAGAVTADHLDGGLVHVLVTAEDPFADDLNEPVRNSFENPEAFDFSMVHYTDSQYLAEGAADQTTSPEHRAVWANAYSAVPEWIAANSEQHKIKYVAHTGDIIENWHHADYADETAQEKVARDEFAFASDAQKLLDDTGIPNGVLPGNHDNRTGTDVGAGSIYNEYFGPERYEALEQTPKWQEAGATYQSWKEGDNENHYDLFSAGGLDFIALYLGYDVTEEEVVWANKTLEQYSDRNAMVLAHAYNKPSSSPDGRGAAYSHDGKAVSEGIVTKNDNVFLVLSGHEHGVSIEVRKDAGKAGNNVVELLADYQFYEVTSEELGLTGVDGLSGAELLRFGSSYLRMLQFDIDRSELAMDTYSPLLDDFGATEYDDKNRYNGTEDDLRLPIQLESRKTSFTTDSVMTVAPTETVIGEATARSGWPASVDWTGLTEGEAHAWYAVSRETDSGDLLSAGSVDQMSVFTAKAAGTDKTAPILTMPASPAEITAGDAFDPLAGVSAMDDTDGDVSANIEVQGTVDAQKAGTYSLAYLVQDANGNQAVAARTVTVQSSTEGYTPPAEAVFSDVATDNLFYREISWLAARNISTGWTEADGTVTFRPTATINRDAMAAFLYRMAGEPSFTPPAESPFTDVATDNVYYRQIAWLADQGISTGWTDANGSTTFRPYEPINRDAMGAFLYRFAGSPQYTAPAASPFGDIDAGVQFYKDMAWLADQDISTGWDDRTYRPLSKVGRDAMAAFLYRLDTKLA